MLGIICRPQPTCILRQDSQCQWTGVNPYLRFFPIDAPLSLVRALVCHTQHFLQQFRWSEHHSFDRPILRLSHSPCVLLRPLLRSASHILAGAPRFLHREKNNPPWEFQECQESQLLVSITGCFPLPWRPGPVLVLHLQIALDPYDPGQNVPISLGCLTVLISLLM